jgi:hypothetical protein
MLLLLVSLLSRIYVCSANHVLLLARMMLCFLSRCYSDEFYEILTTLFANRVHIVGADCLNFNAGAGPWSSNQFHKFANDSYKCLLKLTLNALRCQTVRARGINIKSLKSVTATIRC